MGSAEQLLKLLGALSLIVSGILFYFLAGESMIAKGVGVVTCVAALALTVDALFIKRKKTK